MTLPEGDLNVVGVADKVCFGHLVGRPTNVSTTWIEATTWKRDTHQHMAVLGIVVMILGRHPRKNPPQPY